MKNLATIASTVLLLSSFSSALAYTNCVGRVTRVLDYGNKCTSIDPATNKTIAHLAYKIYSTDSTANPNVSINQWLCSTSERSDALVMGAYFSGRELGVRVESDSCAVLGAAYNQPRYLYLND